MLDSRCAVIIPPLYSPIYPQMGPTIMKGYLNREGYDFEQIDLNIAFGEALRAKIDLTTLSNPDDQQRPGEIENLLLTYFTDRFVASQAAAQSYASTFLGGSEVKDSVEQYNPEVGSGFGYNGILNSSHEVLARFAKDTRLNYYHQFINETGIHSRVAADFDLVGFSLIGPSQFVATVTIAYRLKQENPNLTVVLGGPWATLFSDELAAATPLHDFYDVVVQGEGELPMLEILRAGPRGDFSGIPNVWSRSPDGFSPPSTFHQSDFDDLPPPNYDGLSLDKYVAPRPVMVQASRGCYWGRCAFCVHTAGIHSFRATGTRRRGVEKLLSDLDHLVQTYSPRFVSFADVSISPAVMRRICTGLATREYRLPWLVFLRFENGFDKELLGLMRKAGCFILHFGLESGSDKVLKTIDKGHKLAVARRIIEDAVGLGFRVVIHTMAGLPGETEDDLMQTIDFIKEHAAGIHESYTEVFRLEQHTRIHSEPAKYGIKLVHSHATFDSAIPFENLHGVTAERAMEMVDRELYSFYASGTDLIYRRKSHFSLKHKDDFAAPSRFKATFRLAHGLGTFEDEIEVSTTGGGILRRL